MRSVKLVFIALAVLALLIWAIPGFASSPRLEIVALSNAPDRLSGGDVLVRITAPPGVPLADVAVTLNGVDVRSAFVTESSGRSMIGLVAGLTEGDNLLKAATRQANPSASGKLKLHNYPITGPIFSGPHETPFVCMTQNFRLPASTETLGPPLDANCSAATRVSYVYRSTGPSPTFKAMPSLTAYPADLARTTTSLGQNVPYIVRVETGTINRAIYQTAILHDPVAGPAPTFAAPPSAWNRRLVYTLGGGCTGGW
ncbi:MAG TPA: DUF6351 family protein, partial [Gemmataceae bacterium]|nr:DUF6351 family protein [Gemmataceae bacterium]